MVVRAGPGGQARRSQRWRWLVVFGGGLALWVLAVITIAATGNPTVVPTVILLGSFLVPVTAVVWNFDHEADSALSGQRVAYAFIAGGVLGTIAASLLESWLAQDGVLTYLGVGLIEEFVKLTALVAFSLGLATYTTRDGLVLGAAAPRWPAWSGPRSCAEYSRRSATVSGPRSSVASSSMLPAAGAD